jgi:hypothetical protein
MTTVRNIALVSFLSICVISCLLLQKCGDVKNSVGNDLDPELLKSVTERDSIYLKQDTLIVKSEGIKAEAAKQPRISDLLPIRSTIPRSSTRAKNAHVGVKSDSTVSRTERVGITTNDSTTIFLNSAYDSAQKVIKYKELLFDSLLKVNSGLIATIVDEKQRTEKIDSIHTKQIKEAAFENDSLKTKNKKLSKSRLRWFGYGVVAGKVETYAEMIIAK